MPEPTDKNPFTKGDVVYIACIAFDTILKRDAVFVDARTVKSMFGPTDINLDKMTSAHRSRVSVFDAGRNPDLALAAFLDRTDAALRAFKVQVERLEGHRASAAAMIGRPK